MTPLVVMCRSARRCVCTNACTHACGCLTCTRTSCIGVNLSSGHTLPPWSADFPEPHGACPPAARLLDVGTLWLEVQDTGQRDDSPEVAAPYPLGLPPGAGRDWAKEGGAKRVLETFDVNVNEGDGFKMACVDAASR